MPAIECPGTTSQSPQSPVIRCRKRLAFALVQLGRSDAISLFWQAIRQKPEFAPAWRGLTATLAMAGQDDEARRALAKTMELDPGFSLQAITVRLGYNARGAIGQTVRRLVAYGRAGDCVARVWSIDDSGPCFRRLFLFLDLRIYGESV
jgi:hypothetical protein